MNGPEMQGNVAGPLEEVTRGPHRSLGPIGWGVAFGILNGFGPFAFWWLTPATMLALTIALIAAVYIGFAVADGRPRIIAAEVSVASIFVIVAAIAVTASPWVLVGAFFGHGVKDFWQERHQFVANTRWWPPFCATVDWVAAAILSALILSSVNFHH
jgi:hypothetical protein